MDDRQRERMTANKKSMPSPPRWAGERSLDIVFELNERCLELVSQTAASSEHGDALAVARLNRQQWSTLDAVARQRIARLPFVIVDLHFYDGGWWRRINEGIQADPATAHRLFPPEQGVEFMHDTLMVAWHTAQADLRTAGLTMGMTARVAQTIAALSMRDLRRIAVRYGCEATLRWGGRPELWQQLLAAAQDQDDSRLKQVKLQAKICLVGELLAAQA